MATDKTKNINNADYGADQIQVLEGLDPVRKRPGMYIGSTGQSGLHHLVTEIVNNSMDEAIANHANHVKVEFFEDGSVAVYDNGRGIPYAMKEGYGVTALELAFTKLHAGGKFGGGGYKVSSGLHGVGASVVNALSEWCRVIVKRNGETVIQEYANGGKVVRPVEKLDIKKPVTKIEGETFNLDLSNWDYENGTIVHFKPDPTIFETTDFKLNFFTGQVREYAYLTAKIKFDLMDNRVDQKHSYYFEGGIKSYIKALNRNKKVIHENLFFAQKEIDGVNVEVALQYNDTYVENVLTFANHIKTIEGGTHLTGFRTALTRVINDYARNSGILKEKDPNLMGDDLKEGLTVVISVKLDSDTLQFEGQTKGKLGNSNVRGAVETVTKEALEIFFEENPKDAQEIIGKNVLALKARMAAKAARDTVIRKSAMEGGGVLPGKLADCSEKDPAKTELFVVEGDSAGGCFSGSTTIKNTDGRVLSFVEIVKEQAEGKEHFCYTIKDDGGIGIEKMINARITKKNAEVIKVILDNGKEIICTPDHKFMLRDGKYKQAQHLTSTDSLMPLYTKLSDKREKGITINGYEMAWDVKADKWIYTHKLADKYNLENEIYSRYSGDTRHHVDFNKLNNNPTNIICMDNLEHFKLHQDLVEKILHSPEVEEKSKKAKQTPAFRKKMSTRMQQPETKEVLSANARKQREDEDYKTYMSLKWQYFYKTNEKYRNKNNKLLRTPEFRTKRKESYNKTYLNKALKIMKQVFDKHNEINEQAYNKLRKEINDRSIIRIDTIKERFFEGNEEKLKEAVKNYNHKIIRIEKVEEKHDVYDIEVPNTHNFALANGIFVHNSAKQGRDRETQAILPLFGKPLNTEKARLDKTVTDEKLKNLVLALGTGIGDHYDPTKLRYHKLIIMADADVDGYHIATLYLTFFYRHMKELVETGRIFMAMPPLYKATWGKEKRYLFDDTELDKFKKTKEAEKAVIQRFKGLGEMNDEELWETTMNPQTRKLKRIDIEDAAYADEVFTMLMGEEVAPRKKYIMAHAKEAQVDQ